MTTPAGEPAAYDPATCKSCGARIRWVITTAGKRMPLDPEPHPEGTIVPVFDPARDRPVARVLPAPPTDRDAWRSHFATCPNADQHRRAR